MLFDGVASTIQLEDDGNAFSRFVAIFFFFFAFFVAEVGAIATSQSKLLLTPLRLAFCSSLVLACQLARAPRCSLDAKLTQDQQRPQSRRASTHKSTISHDANEKPAETQMNPFLEIASVAPVGVAVGLAQGRLAPVWLLISSLLFLFGLLWWRLDRLFVRRSIINHSNHLASEQSDRR